MFSTAEALDQIRGITRRYTSGEITGLEVVKWGYERVMEAPLEATEECLAAFPEEIRPYLLEWARGDLKAGTFEYWIMNVRSFLYDGGGIEQARQHNQQKLRHYRSVAERVIALLECDNAT